MTGLFKCSNCPNMHSRFRNRHKAIPASYCKECHAEYMRNNRPKHAELNDIQKLKANARSYANVYQNRNKLIKQQCKCGNINVQKHHEDYTKPLEIIWVCDKCHLDIHHS